MLELNVIARGGSLGYWTGDPLRLMEDMQILKPNFFPAVPRILNRIYQAGMAATTLPGIKGALFRRAVEAKVQRLRTTGVATHALWDRLVFRKVRGACVCRDDIFTHLVDLQVAAVLGGEVRVIGSGSAPLSAAAIEFLRISTGADLLEGMFLPSRLLDSG
jgi:long-chain acyl-CoA synthetase